LSDFRAQYTELSPHTGVWNLKKTQELALIISDQLKGNQAILRDFGPEPLSG
jgi:hypothetical protein